MDRDDILAMSRQENRGTQYEIRVAGEQAEDVEERHRDADRAAP